MDRQDNSYKPTQTFFADGGGGVGVVVYINKIPFNTKQLQ